MTPKKKTALSMQDTPLPRLLVGYALTTFCALLFDALYNLADTLFVGYGVGDDAMGGVSVVFPFMMFQGAVAQMIGGGAASIVSRRLGQSDYEGAGNATANAMFLFYTVSAAVAVVGLLFRVPLLRFFGAIEEILPYAKAYFTVILLGNVFSTGFSSIIRAEGKMRYALCIWLVPTAVNVLLDYVFIYILKLGVTGAALATVCCWISSFSMSVFFFKKRSVQSFHTVQLNRKTMAEILTVGVPTLLQMSGISVMTLLMNRALAGNVGTLGVNAFAYMSKIIAFALVPFQALAQASAPILGFNFGAKNGRRVNGTLRLTLLYSEIYAILGVMLTILFAEQMLCIFTDNTQISAFGTQGLRILCGSLPFVPVILIAGTYFQAVGEKLRAAFSPCVLLVLSAVFIAILPKQNAEMGVWISVLLACVLAAGANAFVWIAYKRRMC